MFVAKSKYDKLEKSYEKLLKDFAKYKMMFNRSNCNDEWKYNRLMARTVKLKMENDKNRYDQKKMETLHQKLLKVTEEYNNLRSEFDKAIQEEVNRRVNEEINLVFIKNAKINEELLQAKEELKWVMWYFNSLKEIYLSEGSSHTKSIILEKLRDGIPECYSRQFEDKPDYSGYRLKEPVRIY